MTIHDAGRVRLSAVPGPFDLIYSFYSVGFHWSLEHFLDEILSLLAEDGTGVFIVPAGFVEFSALRELHTMLLPLNPDERKANRRNGMLLLRKQPFAPPAGSLAPPTRAGRERPASGAE